MKVPIAVQVTLCLLSLVTTILASKNPCHNNKWQQGQGVTCEKVVLPRWLCAACRLKPPQASGDFKNCRSIYDVTGPQCKSALQTYAWYNRECDPVRLRQVADFSNAANVEGLDYFVYSVCEQCCDCVPRGSAPMQFWSRRSMNTLLNANRGNCPAHAWYDICAVWPKVRYVVDPNGLPTPKQQNPNYLCPMLTTWIKRPENNPWLLKSWLWIDPPINDFFLSFFEVADCAHQRVWQSCADLEDKQNRLWEPVYCAFDYCACHLYRNIISVWFHLWLSTGHVSSLYLLSLDN